MDPSRILPADWAYLGTGLMVTIGLCAFALAAGVGLAALAAATRLFPILGPLKVLFAAYVELFRSTPLLVQLILIFFGLPLVGIEVPALPAALLGLSLYSGAYLSGIVWGGLESVPRGQWEASLSLGLSRRQMLRHMIVPQAVRVMVPPAVGFAVALVKASALVSVIGFTDLTRAGRLVIEWTFQPFLIWGVVALLYFMVCYPLSIWGARLEAKVRAR